MYKEYLKTHIIDARKAAKLSKTDMANKLNMSLPTYYKFENSGIISMCDYIKACEILGLHIQIIPKSYLITKL
jgi:transcriptional regulator with XRE-family HTH domain